MHAVVPFFQYCKYHLLFYLSIHFSHPCNICTWNAEENATATCIEESPHLPQGNPMMSLSGKPLVWVLTQGSLFSQISQISLNPDTFSQIFMAWVKWLPPVDTHSCTIWKVKTFMNCSKSALSICKKKKKKQKQIWLPRKEYLRVHRCTGIHMTANVNYFWLSFKSSWTLALCLDTCLLRYTWMHISKKVLV